MAVSSGPPPINAIARAQELDPPALLQGAESRRDSRLIVLQVLHGGGGIEALVALAQKTLQDCRPDAANGLSAIDLHGNCGCPFSVFFAKRRSTMPRNLILESRAGIIYSDRAWLFDRI
jgi:hypothetical protein